MKKLTRQLVDDYLKEDVTTHRLDTSTCIEYETLICQRWLREAPAKRCIYEELYGELFASSQRLRILDVGGGLTSLPGNLAVQHEYILADLLAHDSIDVVTEMTRSVGRDFIIANDWLALPPNQYDIVLTNDLFPNVDQRLELFLERFLPQASRIKIALTWYDSPRFYITKRIDADEVFCMLAWDSSQLRRVLEKFSSRIVNPNFDLLGSSEESLYANGRHVCLVEFFGELGEGR